ncbi:hypothetical protein ANN_22968 [Periplaneta americana]|uniref:Uncharacterized protein n=1 Tax=Periplaneta americana TaxID=6978 RepID=A0ABQ8SL69_PERAM|nr:hypothetical protein ANN_22968 [Periplaneta americana]
MEFVKLTDEIRNEAVIEKVGEERMMLKLIRKKKKKETGWITGREETAYLRLHWKE